MVRNLTPSAGPSHTFVGPTFRLPTTLTSLGGEARVHRLRDTWTRDLSPNGGRTVTRAVEFTELLEVQRGSACWGLEVHEEYTQMVWIGKEMLSPKG